MMIGDDVLVVSCEECVVYRRKQKRGGKMTLGNVTIRLIAVSLEGLFRLGVYARVLLGF